VERRLAAIVAADIVGYSRLVAQDEAGTVAAVTALRTEAIEPVVVAHGGRIVKTMGDGLLMEFASAVNAVGCAAEIQRRVDELGAGVAADRRIVFRIGVNVGDVIVDGDDILGDGVNVAARLEGSAEPGDIRLSAAVVEQVRDRVAFRFEDLGEHRLKNLARSVHVFRLLRHAAGDSTPEPVAFTSRPAVAVLPFANLSGDPAEDYFVDGLTEDIITTLAYWRWFPVIARNSTFVYKGKPTHAREIGKELAAAYLVEGSVRRGGNRIRITAQLIDAATGHSLWVERFERDMDDVFALQEEIAGRVVVSIEPEIQRAEEAHALRTRPKHLAAWDYALRALALQERMSRTCHHEARQALTQALRLDPGSAFAWSLLALCHYHEGILGWAADRGAALSASLDAAQRAIDIDERDWLGQALEGMGRLWTERDHVAALEREEYAVRLNPSAPLARHCLACILEFSGRPADAIPHLQAVLRLDPRYRFASLCLADEAMCRFLMGDFAASSSLAERAVRMQPSNVRARQRLVAALSAQGRSAEASAAASELIQLQPDLSIEYIETTYPFQSGTDRHAFVAALQTAGLLLDAPGP
jgi:adenylate cyclase